MPESEEHLQFGRFKVIKTLGRGGMGKVYLAEDPVIGRKVAIKVVTVDPGLEDDEVQELTARFEREFQSAGTLSHPNIITVYDVGKDGGDTFIAMEFLPGDSWGDILKSGRNLTFGEIAEFATKICSGLDYAHENGIVHRDIKPANILVARNGEPKIADFGVAKLTSTNLTRTGTVVGTPSYMAPEQIIGQEVSGASDQFSIGVILYHMLTGSLPFVGENPTTILYKIVHDDPAAPRVKKENLPEEVDRVLLKALAKKPEDRFPTCRALASALSDALGVNTEALDFDIDHTMALDQRARRKLTKKPRKKRLGVKAAIGFAAAVVGVFALLYFRDALPVIASAEPEAAPVVETQLVSQTLIVQTEQPGASIWKDGEDTDLLTPAEILLEGDSGTEVMLELRRSGRIVAQTSLLLAATMPADWQAVEEIPTEIFAVASSPQGAQVYVNNELVTGSTPTEIELLAGETYELRVSLAEHHAESTSFTFPDDLDTGISQSRRFFFNLRPTIPPGRIVFEAPYPVRVTIEGKSYGPSTSHNIDLRPDSYEIRLTSDEVFLDETRRLRLRSNEQIGLNLPPVVRLRVAAQPGNCRVFINGRFHDETPFDIEMVPNNYEFRFEWPALGEQRTRIERVTRQKTQIFATLE